MRSFLYNYVVMIYHCYIAEGYRRSLAHRIIFEDCACCSGDCLMKLEYQYALNIVEGCIEEVQNLSRAQKKQYMLNKVSL